MKTLKEFKLTLGWADRGLEVVRSKHNVPAFYGGRMVYFGRADGKPLQGTIKGAKQGYLVVQLDGETKITCFYPTSHIQYL
jgi:hypothetical protein